MYSRLNVVLLVVDSLRSKSLRATAPGQPAVRAPFLAALTARTVDFRRAYATECWTLPAHLSMFTGLLPSRHGAHFRSMAYTDAAPTVAERLAAAGYHTEVITRNSIFDGSLPGVTRGFQRNTQVLADLSGLNPLALILALSKPRFRRQIATTGFFHPVQRQSRRFLRHFARATVPADRVALQRVLAQIDTCRRARRPYFIFCNLYDVHAPYPPAPSSIFRPLWSRHGPSELLRMPFALPKLGGHRYLRPGFRMSAANRRLLLGRYHSAIELMDAKLAEFYAAARAEGMLDDTLLIITSDHGEGFGEHGLYLHDASVYDAHLHVPLFIHHPDAAAGRVDDVVSTRALYDLMCRAPDGGDTRGTLLDPEHRATSPIALAEHFHYPHAADALPRYRLDLRAAIAGTSKCIVRGDHAELHDLARDPEELEPQTVEATAFGDVCRRLGAPAAATAVAVDHLRSRSRIERSAA